MAACFCTGQCKRTGSCRPVAEKFELLNQVEYKTTQVGRKKIQSDVLPKTDLDSPRGYRHVGMDHF